MVYKVELTAEAVSNVRAIYDYIGASGSQAAARWYRGLREAIFSLDHLPGRGSRTLEDRRFKRVPSSSPLRQKFAFYAQQTRVKPLNDLSSSFY